MITLQEVELLAMLLARAGVNQIEAVWANEFLNRLRELARRPAAPIIDTGGDDDEHTTKSRV